jgi:hypothetical protein
MSRRGFGAIWQFWHLSDNSQHTHNSGMIFKIQPVLNILFSSLDQFIADKGNSQSVKAFSHGQAAWS